MPAPQTSASGMPSLSPRVRTAFELTFAFGFVSYGLETYNHRLLSADPRYRLFTTCAAVLIGTCGLLPILIHLWPRVGRLACVVWAASVALTLVLAIATKP